MMMMMNDDNFDEEYFLAYSSFKTKYDTGDLIENKYVIEGKLGSGAWSTVFLVHDTQHANTPMALKVMDNDQRREDLFNNEIEAMNLLGHDCHNVVKLYEHFFTNNMLHLNLVLEYCQGGNLTEIIKSYIEANERIPLVNVDRWIVDLLAGLSYIHSKQIVHGDIKPE